MGTEKRHIPINQPAGGQSAGGPDAGRAAEAGPVYVAAAGGRSASGGAGGRSSGNAAPPSGRGGRAGTSAARSASAQELQALAAERDALAAEKESLLAERDALAGERDALVAERDALVTERDALNDSLLRLRAEFDNFRKRTSREVFEAGNRAQCDLLVSLLPVLDNLERALDAAEHHEEGKVLEGVQLTRKMFVDLLSCAGVEEIAGVGTPFDPTQQEAIMVQESDEAEGHVAAVLQKGYRQGDRILRPAKVVVSTGKGEPAVAG